MTILPSLKSLTIAATILASTSAFAFAKDVTISVWAGGTGPNDVYRLDAIEIAAQQLQRQAALKGEDLKITVDKKSYSAWEDFKQALTLAAEAKTAPNIVVSGHAARSRRRRDAGAARAFRLRQIDDAFCGLWHSPADRRTHPLR